VGAAWTGCINEGIRGASCRLRAAEMGAGRMWPAAEGGSQGSSSEAAAGSSLSHGGATGRTWGSGGGG
jgi:hypothetical protein